VNDWRGRSLVVEKLASERTPPASPIIIIDGALETGRSFAYATLIVGLSVIPIFALAGLPGSFLQPLVLSYALAVAASFVVALTVAPALGLLLLSQSGVERRESPLIRWLNGKYAALVGRMTRFPEVATGALVLLAAASIVIVPQLGHSVVPAFKERDVLIRANAAPGTSHPAMMQLAAQAGHDLRAIPGVRTVGADVGRAVLSDRVSGVNAAEIWVSIDPAANYERTLAAIRGVADRYPALSHEVLTYPEERMRASLAGTGEDLVVRVYGLEPAAIRQKAEEVRQSIAQVEGVVAPRIEDQVLQPTIEVEVDLANAQRFGVKPGDVRRSVTALISGISVGSLFEEQKVFDVVVIGVPEIRQDFAGVSEILVDTLTGGHVRLGDVAAVRVVPSQSSIKRDSVARYVDVTASVRGRGLDAVVGDVQHNLQSIQFPREFHAEVLGDLGLRQATQQRFVGYALAALIGIFLLLQSAFGSLRLAVVTLLTLPMALVGGVLAAFVGGGVVSLGSLVGFFTVMGIAARNGIMLVSHYQHLEREERQSFGTSLVLRGARERLAPVLMTALATGLALVPLVVLGEIKGHEIEHPMAVVILGGLVTSTLLNLFVVPALYLRIGRGTVHAPSEG
jgi:Cu/Ag efflux pump CusA